MDSLEKDEYKNLLAATLICSFAYSDDYSEAIQNLKNDLETPYFKADSWSAIKNMIYEKRLLPREPLILVTDFATYKLIKNTDEEAYKWLNIMIKNVERADGVVENYYM